MTLEIREVEIKSDQINFDPDRTIRPTIIPWKGVPMIRSQAIGACIQEILHAVAVQGSQDVVNINIIGDPDTGKTETGKTIAHLIHKRAKIPFSVRSFTREDLLDFKKTLKTLRPANYVLLFPDVSFLSADASGKKLEELKKEVTQIRHLPGGQDVKIVMVKDFHYTKAVPKYLRQNDFTFFTSVGTSEAANMQEIVGQRNMSKVYHFQKLKNIIKIAPEEQKTFTYILGRRGKLTYKYRDPFIPLLYFNGLTLRHIVSPLRTWIDPICASCELFNSEQKFESELDIPKFIESSNKTYGKSIVKAAILMKLRDNGINGFKPSIMSAYKMLDRVLEKKRVTLEDLALHFDINTKRTYTKKKDVDKIIEDSKIDNEEKELLESVLQEKIEDG